jgi:hypothetical protein
MEIERQFTEKMLDQELSDKSREELILIVKELYKHIAANSDVLITFYEYMEIMEKFKVDVLTILSEEYNRQQVSKYLSGLHYLKAILDD